MHGDFNSLGKYNADNLRFNNWDPYPELVGPFSNYKACQSPCAPKENFTPDARTRYSPYLVLGNSWETQPKYNT
jgi:hypothetical protein